jgi:hypothetical protein
MEGRSWDGVLIGWCTGGHVEFTVLFEEIVMMYFKAKKLSQLMKIMFSTGPDNLVETVSRNFPVSLERQHTEREICNLMILFDALYGSRSFSPVPNIVSETYGLI